MRRLVVFNFSVILILTIASSCHVGRYVVWNFADVKDYKKFHSQHVGDADNSIPFARTNKNSIRLPGHSEFSKMGLKGTGWEEALTSSGTIAFIVVKNDTILYENYFHGYKRESIIPSFSVAKTITATLAGIALDRGEIKSIEDPITDYLHYLTDEKFHKITVADLLNMRSGIEFNESYSNPFGDAAKLYYGLNISKQLMKLNPEREPDAVFDYVSVNTQLLGAVLEQATGQSLGVQLQERIWKRIGAEFPASWSVDSRHHNNIKAFCCINARPIDFAKLGRLYLNKGSVPDGRLFSASWYDQSVQFDTAMNYFRYRMGWWFLPARENLTDSTDLTTLHFVWRDRKDYVNRELVFKPLPDFYAEGILGQFVYVDPEKKIIIVRMGRKYAGVKWIEAFRKIAELN